jgi:hypothetical protein
MIDWKPDVQAQSGAGLAEGAVNAVQVSGVFSKNSRN